MYIYIDILIITNIYANFFLLKATAKMTHSAIKNGRCVIGSVIGSLFSLIILLPELNTFLLLLIRIISAAVMVYVTFHGKELSELYKIGLVFFFVCFLFAGIEYAVSSADIGSNTLWHNSVLYINISLLTLVISTVVSYAVLCILRRFLDRSSDFDGDYTLIIMNGTKQISIKAACDTCNNLTDSFSGKPIIICSKSSVDPLFEEKILECAMSCGYGKDGAQTEYGSIKGWRVIPFATINSSGLLPSFLPTGLYIKNNENGKIKYLDAYIGIVERELDCAVFNPKILT